MREISVVKHMLNQSGQALLIIVLVMVVALTIGLSVASRTITNLRNTREQASSQKALSAAEAGVEQAIKSSANVAGNLNTTTSYNTTVSQVSGTAPFKLNGGNPLAKNDAIYVWLTAYSTNPANLWQNPWAPTGGNLTIYWGDNSGACNNAALEISVISGSKTNPTMSRYGVDPCAARASSNQFSTCSSSPPPNTTPTLICSSTTQIGGKSFYYKATVAITNGLLVRVNPLYDGAYMAASGDKALPNQGSIITSTGTTNANTTSSTTRKITVFQGYPEIPAEFFPYTLFQP